jgi:hypothetical protein
MPPRKHTGASRWFKTCSRVTVKGVGLLGRREAAWCAAAIAILSAVVVAIHVSNTEADTALMQASLNGQGAAAAQRVKLLFEPIPSFMRSLARSLAHVTERITHDDWADLAGPLIAALPYVSAFTLLDYVAGADRANWEANMTSEYSRNVSMLEFTVGKSVMPPRARYYVVAAVVGPAMGVLVPGRDAFDNPPWAAAIIAALAANDVVITHGTADAAAACGRARVAASNRDSPYSCCRCDVDQ